MRNTSRLGIFWCYRERLYAASVPLNEARHYGDFRNGPFDHYSLWPRLQRRHAHLRSFAYEDIPRGRVLYSVRDDRFLVYADRILMKEHLKTLILAEFELPPAKSFFRCDEHYTADFDERERLLREDE